MENFDQIVELLKRQDKVALEKLYEQYGRKFYSYCIAKWHLSEDESWDVVYRTLETLVLKAASYSFESQEDFNRFVFKVLINFLRQQYRSRQAKRFKEIEFVNFDRIEIDQTVSKYFSSESLNKYYESESYESPELIQLQSALEELEQFDRDLLLLRAQNYSYDKIAEMLKVENNQLKVRHHRAKKRLLEILTPLQTN